MAQQSINVTQQSDIPNPLFAISYDSFVLFDARVVKTGNPTYNIILTAGSPRSSRLLLANMSGDVSYQVYQPDGIALVVSIAGAQEFPTRSVDLLWVESVGLWTVIGVNQP